MGYLWQAGKGQLAISNRSRPIVDVLAAETTPPRLKELLATIPDIKRFGESHGIKATSNYESYVPVDDAAVVWVVSASDPLRFSPRTWSFPIVGSFTYLGWFDRDQAKTLADQLEAEGLDVYLRGASAYSTLGWFKDPIFSTMIPSGENRDEALGSLVNVVIHESVHATLYVNGQSTFNESFASFVADQLTPVYLAEKQGLNSASATAYAAAEARSLKFGTAFKAAYAELKGIYESSRSDAEKLKEKERVLKHLQESVGAKRKWNNASLVQFKTYGTGQEVLAKLFAQCGSDWRRFFGALKPLQVRPSDWFKQEQLESFDDVINRLIDQGC